MLISFLKQKGEYYEPDNRTIIWLTIGPLLIGFLVRNDKVSINDYVSRTDGTGSTNTPFFKKASEENSFSLCRLFPFD